MVNCLLVNFCFRLHEFDDAVAAVRDGLSKVVPVPLLSLFTGPEVEALICGSPDIPLNLLKSITSYKGRTPALLRQKFSWLNYSF